ncbi:Ig-like domain-containing protein [Nocardioides dongkuii]|uniref:Ig-like domain-containing protein n=1 Tax=Nocardioides dongkuii TaxID=2760089 RepID=UPI0015FA7AF1|nr:Ig-like domain-containing protein [Nocardioides dongkuii]
MPRSVLALVISLTSLLLVAPVLPAQAADVAAVPTTTTLTARVTGPLQVTLDMEVRAEDGSVPTGSVEVREGEDVVATAVLTDGRAATTVSTSVGEHTYVATYVGDAAFQGSESATTVVVRHPYDCRGSFCQPTSLQISSKRVVSPGARPTLKVSVRIKGNAPAATGRVALRLQGPGTRWRVGRDYQDETVKVRLPRLRKVGVYKVTVRFKPAPGSSTEASVRSTRILVQKRRH